MVLGKYPGTIGFTGIPEKILQSWIVREYTISCSFVLQRCLERGRGSEMENHERELIERAVESNFELKKLYSQHQELDTKLKKLGKQSFLTAQEEAEERRLKQLKLRGVEKMLKLAAS
jgi:hypothetical protein